MAIGPVRGPKVALGRIVMDTFYSLLRFTHIAAGTLGLLTLTVPLVAKKGGTVHTRVGWVFTGAMASSALTGLLIAALWIAVPLTVKPPAPSLSAEQGAARAHFFRSFGAFLGFVGILTLSSLAQGIGALGRKTRPEGSLRPLALLLP